MPLQHIFIVYLIGTLLVFLPSFGLARLFEKAGVPAWKAYVPFYNTWVMQEVAHRPKHWVFWQFIPVVGWFITPGIFIEFVKLFGKFTLGQHTLAAIPFGKTISYLELARRTGDTKATRAVASANGKNNIAIIIPCHRVIGSNKELVGYGGGLWRKKWLIEHELKIAYGVQTLF